MTYQPITSNPAPAQSSDVIRITEQDARSTHVDDLLRRNASLRGERGIARDRGRKWYLQNWFVFMIAGTLAAITAWAILNPYFDEFFYITGAVNSIEAFPARPLHFVEEGKQMVLPTDQFVQAKIGSHIVAFTRKTRWRDSNGKYADFDPQQLKEGQTLGVYVNYIDTPEGERSVAEFVNPDPRRLVPDAPLSDKFRLKFIASLLIFPMIAAFIGLFIGAADGIMCRLPRRIFLAGAVGLVFGFVGGFLSGILAEVIYAPLTRLAMHQSGTVGFGLQTAGRGLAWAMAGMAMGLGQGIALRSKRLLLYGFLGGLIGGLLGGMLFDPIDLLILGTDKPSSAISRWVGFAVIGATVGLMIGIVELLARDAWLQMTQGPLVGKEFLVFKDVMRLGSSPKSEIYLFNDPAVAAQHAVIRATGGIYDIENTCTESPVCVNGRPIQRARLRNGDRITLGRTAFLFQRQGAE
ncbi:MAG TPA: FHA domain-containing protein [Tepidisphaeraceae bacterium]|nr:FHA domain-containing protein [Tepidisphaeraceae bacterium]